MSDLHITDKHLECAAQIRVELYYDAPESINEKCAEILAKHFPAEPEDDNELITLKWLISIGFDIRDGGALSHDEYEHECGLQIWGFNELGWVVRGWDFFEMKCRWQIRGLIDIIKSARKGEKA